jgi:hypothetical protein
VLLDGALEMIADVVVQRVEVTAAFMPAAARA